MKKSIQKQYLKRITACVLIFIFSLMCISANAADEVYTKQELDKFDENVRLLSAFGLTDKDRAAATTIKRGDFAAIMLKYLGYDESFYSGGTTFSDVPDEKVLYTVWHSLDCCTAIRTGLFIRTMMCL